MDKFKYFKMIIPMPEYGIKKGDLIGRNDVSGRFIKMTDMTVLPTYLKMDSCVMMPVEMKFAIGTPVLVADSRLPERYPKDVYTVVDFYPKREAYVVKSIKGHYKPFEVSGKYLTTVETYFFIDSKGNVQNTYFGRDKGADNWRMASYNYFKTSDEANAKKASIIAAYAGI